MELKNFSYRKTLIISLLISFFWIIILLAIINFYQKNTITERLTSQNKTSIINKPTDNYDNNGCNQKTKIFEENNISLYSGYISMGKTSLYLKKENKDNFDELTNSNYIDFSGNDTATYTTNIPNIILYDSNLSGSKLYINTDTEKIIKISYEGPYYINIYDQINEYQESSIQVSINNQCDNEKIKKAWAKDINIDGYPQNIFTDEYEIQCVFKNELGSLADLFYTGINENLDKIFFSYETNDSNGTQILKNYSYNLLTKKIISEKPKYLLKLVKGQYVNKSPVQNIK